MALEEDFIIFDVRLAPEQIQELLSEKVEVNFFQESALRDWEIMVNELQVVEFVGSAVLLKELFSSVEVTFRNNLSSIVSSRNNKRNKLIFGEKYSKNHLKNL